MELADDEDSLVCVLVDEVHMLLCFKKEDQMEMEVGRWRMR